MKGRPMQLGVDLTDPDETFRAKANVCWAWLMIFRDIDGAFDMDRLGVVRWATDNFAEFKRWVDAGGHGDYEENLSALLNRDCDRGAAVQATKAKRVES